MTHDMDNLDSKAQGNFLPDGFHGYALSVTSHISRDNHVVKGAPIKLDASDASTPKLPGSYAIRKPSPNDTYRFICAQKLQQ